MKMAIPAPTAPEELDALPKYKGADAELVYSKSGVAKMFKDANGNGWWLLKRPDGTYCKAKVDE